MAVARWVSHLESLLPNHNNSNGANHNHSRTASAEFRRRRVIKAAATAAVDISAASETTRDVVALPDVLARARRSAESFEGNPWWGINSDDVRLLLHATRHGKRIELQTVLALIEGATAWLRIFRRTGKLVVLPPLQQEQTLTIVGDLHGSLSDLATVLQVMPGEEPSAQNRLLFNGDLADRGDHGIETICIVCALCLAYPQHVLVNRGNHEDLVLAAAYDLIAELRTKYFDDLVEPDDDNNDNEESLLSITKTLLDNFFRALPLATLVEDDALIVHAGPPPPGSLPLEQLLCNVRGGHHPVLAGKGLSRTIVDSVGTVCPSLQESQAIIESMLWSDPWVDETGTALEEEEEYCLHHMHRHHNRQDDPTSSTMIHNNTNSRDDPLGWHPNHSRGAGSRYDAGVVRRFLKAEGLHRMVRSHETVQRGCARYEIPPRGSSNSDQSGSGSTRPPLMELFTVFSASRYPCKEGFNQGAVLELRANGEHHITRYATEDDDPIHLAQSRAIEASTMTPKQQAHSGNLQLPSNHASFHQHRPSNERCNIGVDTIRDNLFEAIRHHQGAVLRSLREVARPSPSGSMVLSLDDIVQSLIKSLHLDGDAKKLNKLASKTVLATALGLDASANGTAIELEAFCRSLLQWCQQRKHDSGSSSGGGDPWVSSVFGILDENKDGFIDRSEWVRTIANHKRFANVDAEGISDLLDADGDGRLSLSEWERLVEAMEHVGDSDDDDEEEILEG